MKPTFSFLIFLTAALLSGEELLNLQSTIPVSVEGWTRSKVSGVMPSNWKSAAKMNSEFTCKVIQENGQSVFTCDLKKGCAYFIIPAPEIKVARPTEFSITMKRPEERDCESILSVKGGKTPPMKSIWHGSFLTGIRLTYAPGKQTWKSTINAPDWRNDQCPKYTYSIRLDIELLSTKRPFLTASIWVFWLMTRLELSFRGLEFLFPPQSGSFG